MLLFNPVKRLYSLQTINRYHRYSILSSFQTTDLPNQRTATLLSSHTPKRSLSLAPRIDPSFIDYKANAKLKQFHLSLTNNMKHLKKKMKEDIDESRVASLSSIIESRGFDISWDVEESILYLQKVNHEMNEIIHVSIYQEEEDQTTTIEIKIIKSDSNEKREGNDGNEKENENSPTSSVPVIIRCIESEEILSLVGIERTPIESLDAFSCPDFDYLDDHIKAAFLKYLHELGIDDDFAKIGAAIARQQAKHITYHFLKNVRAFIGNGEIEEEPEENESSEKRKKNRK